LPVLPFREISPGAGASRAVRPIDTEVPDGPDDSSTVSFFRTLDVEACVAFFGGAALAGAFLFY
jgi:hypothetical protein